MDFAGGSRFTTSSVLRMEARDGGCQVRCVHTEVSGNLCEQHAASCTGMPGLLLRQTDTIQMGSSAEAP
jgi:hypothetical protein